MSVPKEDWGFLNEKAFEAALQASVPERLPDKMAAVTPWKRAMGRVLAGTALTALGTNLWGLNYWASLLCPASDGGRWLLIQPAVHNRGRGKADGRACRLDDLPPLSLASMDSCRYTSRDRSPAGFFGTFSLSTAAQHGRGYVVYAADEIPHAEYRNVPDSRFNYSYPYRFLQYPAKTALENRMSDHGAFRTVWSDLRYGPEVTPPVIKKNDQRNDPPAKAGGSF